MLTALKKECAWVRDLEYVSFMDVQKDVRHPYYQQTFPMETEKVTA